MICLPIRGIVYKQINGQTDKRTRGHAFKDSQDLYKEYIYPSTMNIKIAAQDTHLQFENRCIDSLAAMALEDLHDLVENTLTQRHLLGTIVPRALGRLQGELLIGGRGIASQLGLQGQQAGDLLIDLKIRRRLQLAFREVGGGDGGIFLRC